MTSRIMQLTAFRYNMQMTALALGTTAGVTMCSAESEATTLRDQYSPWIPIRIFRPNKDLEIAFDIRTKTPVYVMERLNLSEETSVGDNRRQRFYEEKSLPEYFRARNSHYHLSGYDRGHMAPAADFLDYRSDTYNLINVAPQSSDMNRGVWAGLEKWTRGVARRAQQQQKETYVVTGPLWLPKRKLDDKLFEYQYKGLGNPPSLLAVPTHFFKVVVVVDPHERIKANAIREFACFVVPNEKLPEKSEYQDFLVRWTDLEAVSGLTLFPWLTNESWRSHADSMTDKLCSRKKTTLLLLTEESDARSPSYYNKAVKVDALHLCRDGRCSRPSKKH